LLLKVEVVSPIAKMQQAQDVSSIVEWLQIQLSLGGMEMTMLTSRVEDIFADIGRKLGVSEKYIRADNDKKKIMGVVAAIIAKAQQAGQQPAAAGQAPPAGALQQEAA